MTPPNYRPVVVDAPFGLRHCPAGSIALHATLGAVRVLAADGLMRRVRYERRIPLEIPSIEAHDTLLLEQVEIDECEVDVRELRASHADAMLAPMGDRSVVDHLMNG